MDPDKVTRNARPAVEGDGLLDLPGFKRLFNWHDGELAESQREFPELISAYGSISHLLPAFEGNRYGERAPEIFSTTAEMGAEEEPAVKAQRSAGSTHARVRRGDFEPQWTNCESNEICWTEWI